MMKDTFVTSCQAAKSLSYWHVQTHLPILYRVGGGAELLFYWSLSLPMAENKVFFFQLVGLFWESTQSFPGSVK